MGVVGIQKTKSTNPERVRFTVEIDPQSWQNVKEWAKAHNYPSAVDCLAGYINRALLEVAPHHPSWTEEAINDFLGPER